MHLEAHFGLGWAIGVLAPDSDRRLRNICVVASILPDIDAVTYLWGRETYDVWHHTFGHNIFLGLLVMLGAVWLQRAAPGRQRGLAGALAGLCFGLHLLTDAYFTRYEVYLWWPVNWNGFLIPGGYWLGAPINTGLFYGSFVLVALLALWKRVTPLDIFWPGLDRIVINAFCPRSLSCGTCEKPCNNCCDGCGAPTCMKHGAVGKGFRINCPACGPVDA